MQTHTLNLAELLLQLEALGTKERSERDVAYHKSKRIHWGVPAPAISALAKTLSKEKSANELLMISKSLWESNLFDPMILAAKLLALPKAAPSPVLWNLILSYLPSLDGWALEDTLAHAAWKCLLLDDKLLNEVETWTRHENFWIRRAALVYTLPFAKPGKDPERMLSWAAAYAEDTEWFIQKAIGWWLRVLGEHNPKRVLLFLDAHGHTLKGVAKKEATRKLYRNCFKG